jgi:dolichol kinase
MKGVTYYLIKEFVKLMRESLQRCGKYEWDKITTFVSFSFLIFLTLVDMFTKYKINEVTFFTFVALAGGSGVASITKNSISANKEIQINKVDQNPKTENL